MLFCFVSDRTVWMHMDEIMWSEDKVRFMLVDSTYVGVKVWLTVAAPLPYSQFFKSKYTNKRHIAMLARCQTFFFSVNNSVTWSNIYLCYACPHYGLLMARLMVKCQRYETAWRKWEKGRETLGEDYWDLPSKSPQRRCTGSMKLSGTQTAALWGRET